MALLKQLVKISNYTGLYLKDSKQIFKDFKTISASDIQKKIKPPYTIVVRFYNNKKAIYRQINIVNEAKTVKRICDEISAQRQIIQIEKSFKSKSEKKNLNDVFLEWIQLRKRSISQAHYKNIFFAYNKWIKNQIGYKNIKEIETKDMQRIVNLMLDVNKSPRTSKSIKDILSPVFTFGIKNKYCLDNPAKDITIPKFDNQMYFTIEIDQAKRLYHTLTNYPNITIRGIFIFLLHGRRKKEVLNLKWENININQKIYFLKGTQNKSAKNLVFPLTNIQIQILNEIGIEQYGYIFTKDDGTPYKDIRFHWEKIKKELSFDMRLHDLRHMIGFLAINAGISLEAISKTLGHSNIQVTQRYSNVRQKTIEDTLSKVFNIVDGSDSK